MNSGGPTNSTQPGSEPTLSDALPETLRPGTLKTLQSETGAPSDIGASPWRDELAAKVDKYRARRKPRLPRYPSLRLRFEHDRDWCESTSAATTGHCDEPAPEFENRSDRALALDRSTSTLPGPIQQLTPSPSGPSLSSSVAGIRPHPTARILEFPRSTMPEPPPADELAEPVMGRPRILEAPEITSSPALGGITIEAVQQKESEKRPGIDYPLQSAPLGRRFLAAACDWMVVAVASALFGMIFWKVTTVRPPQLLLLSLGIAVPSLIWSAYQYVMIVYSGGTPGLRLAGLAVTCFDGARPNRARRRWRVLASYLSGISLGMGYAWLFLDEDGLCWHDRITRTYLAPAKH